MQQSFGEFGEFMDEGTEPLEGLGIPRTRWAVVKVWREVIPCRVSEVEFAGERFVRAELIRSDGSLFCEQLIKPGLITRITIIEEAVAKAMCDRLKPKRIALSRANGQEDAA